MTVDLTRVDAANLAVHKSTVAKVTKDAVSALSDALHELAGVPLPGTTPVKPIPPPPVIPPVKPTGGHVGTGAVQTLDFTSGSPMKFNGWDGADNKWGAGSSVEAVAPSRPGSGRSRVGRFTMGLENGSGGTSRVLLLSLSRGWNIRRGDSAFFSYGGRLASANPNGALLAELHDPYPGTDDARIPNCVAPVAICLEESAYIDPADWAASPMRDVPRSAGRGQFVWNVRRCFGDGTTPGRPLGYDRIVSAPLAHFTPGAWGKIILRVDVHEDERAADLVTAANPLGWRGTLKAWGDFTSDTAPRFDGLEAAPMYEVFGPTTKWTSGTPTIPRMRGDDGHAGPLYPEAGIYRSGPPGSPQEWELAGWNRHLTFADAVKDFG